MGAHTRRGRGSLAERMDRDAIWGFPVAFLATMMCVWAAFDTSPVVLTVGLVLLAGSIWLAVDYWRLARLLKRSRAMSE